MYGMHVHCACTASPPEAPRVHHNHPQLRKPGRHGPNLQSDTQPCDVLNLDKESVNPTWPDQGEIQSQNGTVRIRTGQVRCRGGAQWMDERDYAHPVNTNLHSLQLPHIATRCVAVPTRPEPIRAMPTRPQRRPIRASSGMTGSRTGLCERVPQAVDGARRGMVQPEGGRRRWGSEGGAGGGTGSTSERKKQR